MLNMLSGNQQRMLKEMSRMYRCNTGSDKAVNVESGRKKITTEMLLMKISVPVETAL